MSRLTTLDSRLGLDSAEAGWTLVMFQTSLSLAVVGSAVDSATALEDSQTLRPAAVVDFAVSTCRINLTVAEADSAVSKYQTSLTAGVEAGWSRVMIQTALLHR